MGEDQKMAGTKSESSRNVQPDEVPAKKKRLSFKAFRQLFSRRKRNKSGSKDEDGGIKAKSIPNMGTVQEDDESSQLAANKNLSMSHDSVFSPDKPRETPDIGEMREVTRSMQVLNNPFTAELSQAVKGRRRNEDEDEDEALPASPITITTTADVLQNGLKSSRETSMSQESDQSLLSMGDSSGEELEGEFFKDQWGVASSKLNTSEDSGHLDLDIVKSSSSLNTSMLDHKRAVRPRNVRPISKHTRVTPRSTSPKPPAGAIQVLPLLKEEVQAKEEEEEVEADMSIEEEEVEAEMPEPKEEEQQKPKEEEQRKPKEEEQQKPDDKSKVDTSGDFRNVVLRKTSVKEIKSDSKGEGATNSVVMRASSGAKADPSKRSTIAVGAASELTIFGERKVSTKRSSLTEAKNWEEGKEEKPASTGKGTEFAQLFHKFQRKTSLKLIELQKEGEKLEENRHKEQEHVKKILSSPKKEVTVPSPKEEKKEVVVEKVTKTESVKVESMPAPKLATSGSKPKEMLSMEKPKSAVIIEKAKPQPGKVKPVMENKPKTVVLEKPKTEPLKSTKSPSTEKKDTAKPEPKPMMVIEKAPSKAPAKNNEDKENENSYKRSNPLPVNRARSQTLPEQPVSKDVIDKKKENESSPEPIKKANSTEENLTSGKSTPSAGNSPQRSSSVLIKSSSRGSEPKRLTIKDSNSGGVGGQPAWVAMARRKTQAFGEDEEKEKKDNENEAKKKEENKSTDFEDMRSKRKSKVLDMVKNWQQ